MELTRLQVEVPGPDHHRQLISCQVACPVHTDARGYVRAIAEGRYEEAYLLARGPNPFASICGRVCAAPCEVACRRGKIPLTDADGCLVATDLPISIRGLKRFACEQAGVDVRAPEQVWKDLSGFVPEVSAGVEELAHLLQASRDASITLAAGESIGIVGAGPAGLSAAHDLALLGFRPVVYEVEKLPAGMLVFGVPGYRLPRELVAREIEVIRALGVEFRCGVQVGKDISFAELRRRHRAVLIAVGAKRPRLLGLPGEAGPGVYGGVDLLRSVALGEPLPLGNRVVVIGGGNVAYDVARTVVRQVAYDTARTAARLQGERTVQLVSLEELEEMPADTVEIREGEEEGIERLSGFGPLAVERDPAGRVSGLRVRRCLRVYDAQRRFAPVFDDREVRVLPCDTVLIAAGQTTDLSFLEDGGGDVEQGRPGWPKVDPATLATTAPGVFVAGDLAHGTRLIIDAVASGKRAARAIYRLVTGRALVSELLVGHRVLEGYRREKGYERIRRVELPTCSPAERLVSPGLAVEQGYSEPAARREASRCLDCGVTPVFDGVRCVLCGGCADVCPTLCLKLVTLDQLAGTDELRAAVSATLGEDADWSAHSAILKDEDRCIRCALCAHRCPADAITMERVESTALWRTA